jgi:hypothetical protein
MRLSMMRKVTVGTPIVALLVLLAGASTSPVWADMISPIQPGAATYNLTSGPVPCAGGICQTTLVPPGVINLGAATNASTGGGPPVTGLQQALNAQFPGYNYAFGGDLNIVFNITQYSAFNTGTMGGANFIVDITDPNNVLPAVPGTLHWVQWVNDNANITGFDGANLTAPMGLGNHENTIDGSYPQPGATPPYAGSPFYDSFGPGETPFATSPPHFTDTPSRIEPNATVPVIVWDADLYLVSQTAANQITFYDGLEWGWDTTFTPTPEPSTWAMMFIGLGMVAFMVRRGAAARLA